MAGLGFNVRIGHMQISPIPNLAFVLLHMMSGLVLFCVACRTTETYGLESKEDFAYFKTAAFLAGIFALSTIFFKETKIHIGLVSYCILSWW